MDGETPEIMDLPDNGGTGQENTHLWLGCSYEDGSTVNHANAWMDNLRIWNYYLDDLQFIQYDMKDL